MHASNIEWLWTLSPVAFVGLWFGMSFFIARMSGWEHLAAVYARKVDVQGERFRFRSAGLKKIGYNNSLIFTVGAQGFGMATIFLFRVGHTPMLMPWADVSFTRERIFLRDLVRIRFARAPSVVLTIPAALAEEMGLFAKVKNAA